MVLGNLLWLTLLKQGLGLGHLTSSLPTSATVKLCCEAADSRFHQVISLQSALN